MKLRTLSIAVTVILSLLLLCANFAAQPAKRTRQNVARNPWYVFVSPDGDFTVSFPQKPNREPDGQGPRTAIRSYALTTQNQIRFSINFQDVVDGPSWSLANEWNDDYERDLLKTDRENKRRVVQTRRIGKNTFEAEIWDSGSDNGESINYVRRTIIRKARIYTLLCGSEIYGREVDKKICRRFFNSMHFVND